MSITQISTLKVTGANIIRCSRFDILWNFAADFVDKNKKMKVIYGI